MTDIMRITVHRDGALLHQYDVPAAAQAAIIAAMEQSRPVIEYPKVIRADDGRELGTAMNRTQEAALLRRHEDAKADAA